MLKKIRCVRLLPILLLAAAPAFGQAPGAFPFRATNYDVEVVLHPENQTISALAKVDFVANQIGRTLVVELHPDLQLSSIKSANGQMLNFQRDNTTPMRLNVGLNDTPVVGKTFTLTFEYNGPISSEEDSPTRGLRFASVTKTGAYLLLPARWFPLTDYPSNRFTGTFKIVAPDTFAVTGTGTPDSPVSTPATGNLPRQTSYVFRNTTPGPVGSFVAGALQLSPVQTEGYKFSVYTPPAQANTAAAYANSLAHILGFYSESFGAFPTQPDITIAQLPDGTVPGYSAPGLLLISSHLWTPKANDRELSQLAAGQWWGYHVLPATYADAWLTDGLSRYAEAMYAEQADGVAGLHKALDDFAIGALTYEDTTPIAQAARLGPYSDQYRSVVQDKGAMVFHMLRSELGDDNFSALLRDFYKQHDGQTATIDAFEKLAATKIPPPKAIGEEPVNLLSFFSQWINSTGVPEFGLTYMVYRTPKGFKVVGKLHQDLDTFRMPVEVRVDTEGNPETEKVLISGTDSQFEIDTFGRPKPNGVIIDPNNNLLKSSAGLRVRAAVARGEAQAALGKYFEAIQEYQRALDLQANNSLAQFRMGEALFYQKNYQAAANSFRSALGGGLDPKWVEVWSHIYIGKIYDLLGQRERAVNEYNLAQRTKDDTAGAQAEAALYIQKPYNGDNSGSQTATAAVAPPATPPSNAADSGPPNAPVLKRRTE